MNTENNLGQMQKYFQSGISLDYSFRREQLLKPSEVASATSAVIAGMFKENFDAEYISVYEGERSAVIPALMGSFRFNCLSIFLPKIKNMNNGG